MLLGGKVVRLQCPTALSEKLGVSQRSVSIAVKRGEQIARFVLDQKGNVVSAEANPDYTHRPEQSEIVEVLKKKDLRNESNRNQ